MGGPKGKEFKEHLMVIEDSFAIFYWPSAPTVKDDFKTFVTESCGAIDFSGMKVRNQEGLHKAWFQELRTVHNDFKDFLLDQFPDIMNWTGTLNAVADYPKQLAAVQGQPPAWVEAPPAPPAPVKVEEIKVEVAKPKPVAKGKPAKKPPTKVLKFKTWEVYDYDE